MCDDLSNSQPTASTAKILVSLSIEHIIEEGSINEQKTLGEHVPQFRQSEWESIRVIDVMDMTTGLDSIDGPVHVANPDDVVTRMLMANMVSPIKAPLSPCLRQQRSGDRAR